MLGEGKSPNRNGKQYHKRGGVSLEGADGIITRVGCSRVADWDVGFLVTEEKGRWLHSTADSSLPGKGQQDKDFSAQV